MRIFLIGFMGSGKSTLGKQVARKLGFSFVDQDEYIERKTGVSVGEYFSRFGESAFRALEHESLKELIAIDNVVIATGGGAPCFHSNIDIMNENGIAIYLKLRPEVLKSRLKNAQNERPLIKGKSELELLEYIKAKLLERDPYYSKAKHIIESIDLKAEDLVQLIKYHKAN
jgi:shikimate kinase